MKFNNIDVAICIPTLNPGELSKKMVDSLMYQSFLPDEIIVIDSSSTDGSINAFKELDAKVVSINRDEFDHGGTRNLFFDLSMADVYVFLTQDAIPIDADALRNLVNALHENPECALVYGRQSPSINAGAFARHARLHNYPPGNQVVIKKIDDIPRLGIKTAFCSNSFSAYRRSAMENIGFFPVNTLFAEDSIAAAKLLQSGWQVGYVPNAVVLHSHDYSFMQEFRRYFDVGAFHSMNEWYIDLLGKADGEGVRFVLSEYRFIKSEGISFPMIRVVFRNGIRWLGYRAGRHSKCFPLVIRRMFSTNNAFWTRMASSVSGD